MATKTFSSLLFTSVTSTILFPPTLGLALGLVLGLALGLGDAYCCARPGRAFVRALVAAA